MSYDEKLAGRIRNALAGAPQLVEKSMFGGLAFMVGGHMCCGVLKDELVLRLPPAEASQAFGLPHVRPMDFTGRVIKSYVMVGASGCRTLPAVRRWTERSVAFVATLPPKRRAKKSKPMLARATQLPAGRG